MALLKEFKEFALKGNVVDLAIAIIIGGAFGAIVTSLVEHIITPLILAPLLDKAGLKNLEDLSWGAVKYGQFLSTVISFVIIAWALFLIIKGMNSLKRTKEEAVTPPAPEYTLQEKLLMEIRDSLRK